MLVLYTIMSLSWLYLDSGPMAGEKKVVKVEPKVLYGAECFIMAQDAERARGAAG